MAYQIHIIGEGVKEVNTQEDAVFHLGAKYGAQLYNQAYKEGYIKYLDNTVKVSPFEVKGSNVVYVNGNKKTEYRLVPKS
jgi:hypothetical protein